MEKGYILRRFYLVLFLMAFTLYTGMATGFGLFYRLLYILAITLVLSFIWSRFSMRSLEVTVDRRTRRASVGDTVEERITVRNLGRLPKSMLEVEDITDLPGYSSGMIVGVPSKDFRSWRTLAPARKRGVYTMGPVRVSSADMFGLFRRERLYGDTENLVVYPRTFDARGFDSSATFLSGESSTRSRSHDLTPHAGSVREYAYGDSLSRIHWSSTARLGRLMSKEFDLGRSSDVWLLVDLHEEVQAGEMEDSTDEYAVSIAASLAKKYLEAQLPVGLIAYGDKRYFLPSDTGLGQYDRIMEFLAMSKAEGKLPLEAVLPEEEAIWGYHSSLVVITSSPRVEWVLAIRELMRRRVGVAVILLDGDSFGGYFNIRDLVAELYVAGIPPYIVKMGDDMAVALSAPVATPTEAVSSDRLAEAGATP
jgi:uncharacterized protein (DUF58 family)